MASVFMLASTCLSLCVIIWALRLSRRVAAAEANALIDPLTGVFNRRGWNALVGRETGSSTTAPQVQQR